MAKDIIALNDRLNVIKLRIKNKEVDDIDYFTFPARFLEYRLKDKTELDRLLMLKNQTYAKKIMIKEMLNYAKHYKAGRCKFPEALTLLNRIRRDRFESIRDEIYIRNKV